MTERPTAIDQSWSTADPATVAREGVTVVSMYLSNDSTKNMTSAKVKAYHKFGVAVLFNWESEAGRPLLGATAGHVDGATARKQADLIVHNVGYRSPTKLAIVASCDRDVNSSQYPQIDAYYRAFKAELGDAYLLGAYGEADLMDHLAGAGITSVEWQASAWSYGRISTHTDLYQYLNGQTLGGASVDFDRVIHAAQLGAWWPPGREPATPPVVQPEGSHPLADLTDTQLDQIATAVAAKVWKHPHTSTIDGTAVTEAMETWVARARLDARTAALVVSDVVKRVAALQAAVASLSPVNLDPAKIADSVVAKIKALMWGVK